MKGFLGLMHEGIAFIVDIGVLDFRWIRHDCCRFAWIQRWSPIWGFRTLFTFAAIGTPRVLGKRHPSPPRRKIRVGYMGVPTFWSTPTTLTGGRRTDSIAIVADANDLPRSKRPN